MTPADLATLARSSADGYLVLTKPAPRRPVRETAALLPGLNGRVLAHDGKRVTLLIEVEKLIKWLTKRGLYEE